MLFLIEISLPAFEPALMMSVVYCSSSEESGGVVSCMSAYMSKITYTCVRMKL